MLLSFNSNRLAQITHMGCVSYKEPWMHFKRLTDEFILYIIRSGELYIKEEEQKYILKKGDFFLLQPGLLHVGFEKACCDYYFIHFKHPEMFPLAGKCFDEIAKEIIFKRNSSLGNRALPGEASGDSLCYVPKHYNISSASVLMHTLHILQEAVEDYGKKYENYQALCSYKLSELLVKVARDYATSEIEKLQPGFSKAFIKVQGLLNFLNTEYAQKITGTDIENKFDSNFDYLNRVFHKMTGYTIFNHLNIVRVNKAKRLIETTSVKFSEVAYLVGINDPYYFSKIFKKYTGMSPMQFCKNRYRK